MEELSNKVNLLTQYNQCLENEIKTYKRQIQEVQKYHKDFEEFDMVKNQLENLKREYFLAMNKITQMSNEINRLSPMEKKLNHFQGKCDKLNDDRKKVLDINTKNESRINELILKNNKLTQEKTQLMLKQNKNATSLQTLTLQHEKQSENLKKIIAEQKMGISQIQDKLDQTTKNFEERLSLAQNKSSKLTDQLNQQKSMIQTYEQDAQNYSRQINTLNIKIKELEQAKINLEGGLNLTEKKNIEYTNQLDKTIKNLEEKLVLTQSQNQDISKQLDSKNQKIASWEKECQNKEKTVAELNSKVEQFQKARINIEQKLKLAQDKNKQILGELKLKNEQISSKEKDAEKQSFQIKSLNIKLEDISQRLLLQERSFTEGDHKNQDKLLKLQQQIQSLNKKHETKVKENIQLQKELKLSNTKNFELEDAEIKLKEKQKEKEEDYETKIKKLQNEILIFGQNKEKSSLSNILESYLVEMKDKELQSLKQIIEDQKKYISEQTEKMSFLSGLVSSKQNQVDSLQHSNQVLKRQLTDSLKDAEKVRKQLVTKRSTSSRGSLTGSMNLKESKCLEKRRNPNYLSQTYFPRNGTNSKTYKTRTEDQKPFLTSSQNLNLNKRDHPFDPEHSISEIDIVYES